MRYPAALPAIALCAGIAAGMFVSPDVFASAYSFAPSVALAAAAVCFFIRRDRACVVFIACGFVLAGVALGRSADSASRNTPLSALFDRHLPAGQYQIFSDVQARLRTDAVIGPSGVSLDVGVEHVEIDGSRHAASGGALIGVGGGLASDQISQWRAGRRIAFPATLRRPTEYLDPGVPGAVRSFAWRGVSLTGSVKSDRLVEVTSAGNVVDETASAARYGIRKAIRQTVGRWDQRSAAVVTAILIGDRAGLGEEVERRLQEAGTYHVIAISGGNIAILAALCLYVLRAAMAGPRVAALIVIGVLTAYAWLVQGGSSVGRATLMAVIYFAIQIWDHRSRPANVAALAATLIFCADPLQVVDAGFALTFGATVGILLGMARLNGYLPPSGITRAVAQLFAASACAEIALLPIGALIFSRITFAGLVVNLAAIPAMTVVQIAGMTAVALSSPAPELARAAGWIAHMAVEALIGSAALVDWFPWLTRRVAPPHVVVIVVYYAALTAALATGSVIGPRRRGAAVLIAAACGVWIVAAPAISFATGEKPLRVTFLDVGQGDAALVQFPDGRNLSIDAGGLVNTTFDIASRVISPAFWALGVRRLDYMSITHGDADHIGGAASLFRDFKPFEIWEGVPVPPHKLTRELRALADRAGTVWRTLQPLDRASFGDVEVVVHHPPRPDWERQRVRNDDSEVIEIRHAKVSFVFSGDIGREVETTIAATFEPAAIRILKVPHHGSATSSSQRFLDALRPDIAVISAGKGNPFGHPAPAVVERYRKSGAAIYRTDHDGAVTVETDGTTVRVKTFTGRSLTLTTHGR